MDSGFIERTAGSFDDCGGFGIANRRTKYNFMLIEISECNLKLIIFSNSFSICIEGYYVGFANIFTGSFSRYQCLF